MHTLPRLAKVFRTRLLEDRPSNYQAPKHLENLDPQTLNASTPLNPFPPCTKGQKLSLLDLPARREVMAEGVRPANKKEPSLLLKTQLDTERICEAK